MDFSAKIRGADLLQTSMAALPKTLRNRALRPALREGAKPVKQAAIENIKAIVGESERSKGLLARSIVIRSLKMRRGILRVAVAIGRAVSALGVRVGLYGSVLEYGKANQRPQPFLRPAIRNSDNEVITIVVREARARLGAAVEEARKTR